MLVDKHINVTWNKANKQYYQQLGYAFTNYGDEFNVAITDLQPGCEIKVQAICDFCNRQYSVAWYHYVEVENKNQKHACYNCRHVKIYENNFEKRREKLYLNALGACEKMGYVLLSDIEEIQCNTSHIRYICPTHGEHHMRISNLIQGKGCPDCVGLQNRNRFKLSPDDVERRINELGGNLLNKNDYINQTSKNLLVDCIECGSPFLTSLRNFTQHGGQVCPNCFGVESMGEKRIRIYLESRNILFVPQKWFNDCRDKKPLPFDFYLPDYNILIEFDGRQHFEETDHFTYSLEVTQKHDKIKNDYCKDHNMRLIRIPYLHMNKIEQILNKELVLHEDIV